KFSTTPDGFDALMAGRSAIPPQFRSSRRPAPTMRHGRLPLEFPAATAPPSSALLFPNSPRLGGDGAPIWLDRPQHNPIRHRVAMLHGPTSGLSTARSGA